MCFDDELSVFGFMDCQFKLPVHRLRREERRSSWGGEAFFAILFLDRQYHIWWKKMLLVMTKPGLGNDEEWLVGEKPKRNMGWFT